MSDSFSKILFFGFALFISLGIISSASPTGFLYPNSWVGPPDSLAVDTASSLKDRRANELEEPQGRSPLNLDEPSNVSTEVAIDEDLKSYTIEEKVGDDIPYRPPSTMTFQEFAEYQRKRMVQDYWRTKLDSESPKKEEELAPPLFEIKRAGEPVVEIRPSGFVTLDLGGRWQRVDNPAVPIRQQKTGGFEFDQQISLNLVGKIGDRLNVNMNWDTKATFDFDNNIKIAYEGKERDIIKSIEAGNVSMPINNTLIRGAQNLFGVKAKLQFGRLGVTALVSNQRGKTDTEVFKSGAKSQAFDIQASEYDVNRHFFLSQFFRSKFKEAFERNPTAPNTGFKVTRVEVFVTNTGTKTEALRDFVAFMDLGENGPGPGELGDFIYNPTVVSPTSIYQPSNESNDLLDQVRADPVYRNSNEVVSYLRGLGLSLGTDFERVTSARKLEVTDYEFNPDLGYVSLNYKLKDDEAIAVSYEYTFNGRKYKVGELTEDYQALDPKEVILLKMLKPQSLDNSIPTWDLMMKNIYRLNNSGIKQDNFRLKIIYKDDITGVDNPSLQEGQNIKDVPLVQLLGMDKLNLNGDLISDGNFDYIEGATVVSRRGQVIFSVLEPFGSDLTEEFQERDPGASSFLTNKYVYNDLYRSTQNQARQKTSRNKFFLQGSYESTVSGDIRLRAFNVSEESVSITVGSITLQPGVDFTVNQGQVKILNEGALASGNDIVVKYESPEYFSFRTKSLVGTRLDYQVNKDFLVGATVMHLNERPLITRVNTGDEPIKNTQIGLDLNYKDDSRVLTKLVDKLPVIQTKAKSTVALKWEGAALLPGKNKLIDRQGGTSYIDDFEGSANFIDIGSQNTLWRISSTPRRLGDGLTDYVDWQSDSLQFLYHRSKLSVFNVDRTFYTSSGAEGITLKDEETSNNYTRPVTQQEIYSRDVDQINNYENLFNVLYYPAERGSYNYNTSNLEIGTDGRFLRPELNWAGVTRPITTDTDFDNANIEYIEFWLMDPFHEGGTELAEVLPKYQAELTGNPDLGGDVFFNLGDISEDLIKDSRHGFENGLPDNVETTIWGDVTTEQFLNNAFDNSKDRSTQDVGMDGLNNEREQAQFSTQVSEIQNGTFDQNSEYVQSFVNDPSSDDFSYYTTGSGDDRFLLERYTDWKGLENNSPINSGGSFTPASTTVPDNEDLNRDNTLNINDKYYQYKFSMYPGMSADNNPYIIEEKAGENNVNWYLVRIPIKEGFTNVGDISGFQTIKFLRMYLTNFKVPVVMRMSQFRLVSSQWRGSSFQNADLTKIPKDKGGALEISVVNFEENGSGVPDVSSPYVLPPGIERDFDQSSNVTRQLNEQSLKIEVTNLDGQYTKGAFKNMTQDLIAYKRLRMFIHGESVDPNTNDGDVQSVLRLGTDSDEHYYEIELPMVLSNVNSSDPNEVWRSENEIDIAISDIIGVKVERNSVTGNTGAVYSKQIGKYKVTVNGNPDISSIRTIFLGLRNDNRAGDTKNVTAWFNELRVTDFNTSAGYATTANLQANLADLGNINLTGSYKTAGYGDIEQKIGERARENTLRYGASTNLAIDKFIPGKTGIQLPLYMSYDKEIVEPQYDPLNPDVLTEDAIESKQTQEEKDDYADKIVYEKTIKSINVTNVKKTKVNPEAKPHVYDVENLSLSAGYSEEVQTGISNESQVGNNLAEYKKQKSNLGLTYEYSPKSKSKEPFKKIGFLKSKHLALVRDFNFTLMPSSFAVTMGLDRTYISTQLYNSEFTTAGVNPLYEKVFYFNRDYSLRWNLTKSISVSYLATANALVDEPQGNRNGDPGNGNSGYTQSKSEYRDSVWTNIKNFGRMKNFDQSLNVTYKLPFKKIPILSWINADLGYKGGYNWTAGAFGLADSLGHTISNKRDITLNGKLNFVTLYNKSKWLKKINSPSRRRAPRRTTGKDDTPPPKEHKLAKSFVRLLMMLRNVSGRYTLSNSIYAPGFLRTPKFFGVDNTSDRAPGLGFAFGSQNYAALKDGYRDNGWGTTSDVQNQAMARTETQKIDLKMLVEPINNFRINVTADQTDQRSFSEIYRVDGNGGAFSETPQLSGSISTSYMPIETSFESGAGLFKNFEGNRSTIRQRRLDNGYQYNLNSQEVLIPSFLAAYSGTSAESAELSNRPKNMLPNWRVDYSGLSKIKSIRKIFTSISLTHGYSSSYTIGSYASNLDYSAGDFDLDTPIDEQGSLVDSAGNTIPIFVINQVAITEKFAPLIGVNVRTKSRMSFRFDYNKSRSYSLNMANTQVTETAGQDFVFGFGFTKKNMAIPFFKSREGTRIVLKNDITFKIDFSIREEETIQRTLDGPQTTTSGNWNMQLKPNVSYRVNKRVNLQMYFERTINDPKISSSFKRSTTAFGFRLRFNLA